MTKAWADTIAWILAQFDLNCGFLPLGPFGLFTVFCDPFYFCYIFRYSSLLTILGFFDTFGNVGSVNTCHNLGKRSQKEDQTDQTGQEKAPIQQYWNQFKTLKREIYNQNQYKTTSPFIINPVANHFTAETRRDGHFPFTVQLDR